jgi:hypothetical protein
MATTIMGRSESGEPLTVTYYQGARWATLQGDYTPEELRAIADEIVARYARVPKRGDSERSIN